MRIMSCENSIVRIFQLSSLCQINAWKLKTFENGKLLFNFQSDSGSYFEKNRGLKSISTKILLLRKKLLFYLYSWHVSLLDIFKPESHIKDQIDVDVSKIEFKFSYFSMVLYNYNMI